MKNINIYELHDEINRRKEKRTRSFEKILEICHKKIKNASKKELFKVYFDVPDFVLGLPVYDLTECIKYIVHSLQSNGFLVKYIFPKLLYISWDFKEINNVSEGGNKILPPYKQIEHSNANKLIMKPSTAKKLEHRPNGKFILNID